MLNVFPLNPMRNLCANCDIILGDSSNLLSAHSDSKEQTVSRMAGMNVHVFDSKSASAGEVLIAVKIGEMIHMGHKKSAIVSMIERFIKQMKTYFVLEKIDNFAKNGRLHKITAKLISILNIKPIMSSDGDGNIALFSYARGESR